MSDTELKVTPYAARPAGRPDECFYCHRKLGENHISDCVLIRKKVKIRLTVEYDVSVPFHWDASAVDFHRNGSSWCVDNCIDELKALAPKDGCLCRYDGLRFEYIEDTSGPFAEED